MKMRILNKLVRAKRQEEVGGWGWSVWFMTDVVAVVNTAVMVGVVAMLNVLCGCVLGVAMSVLRMYCSHLSI